MIYRTLTILFLLFIATGVRAEEPPVKKQKLSLLSESFDWNWNEGEFRLLGEAGITSRNINSRMVSNYLFGSSFSDEAKEAFLTSNHTSGNSQGIAGLMAEYKLSDKRGVYAGVGFSNFLRSSSDMNKMILFGNKHFEDRTIESENFGATAYRRISFGLTHQLVHTDEWSLKASTGISLVSNYSDIRANRFSMYTAPNGEYIDLEMRNTAISETDSNPKGGLGLDFTFRVERRFDRMGLTLEASDIAPTFLSKQQYTYIDSSFRFEGSEYDPSNGSLSLAAFSLDSSLREVAHTTGHQEVFHLLPMQLNLGVNYALDTLNSFALNVRTWDLGFYGVQVRCGYTRSLGKHSAVHSSVSWNTFGALQWSEGIEYSKGNWCALLRFDGINGLIAPNKPSGYGVSAGLLKRL